MKTIIDSFSEELTKDLGKMKIFDISEIKALIKTRMNFAIKGIMQEYSTKAELEYIKLLEEQSRTKLNSKKYVQTGYKLSAAKHKKAAANRAVNNIGRNDKFERLRIFVIDNFGKSAMQEFQEINTKNQ